MNRLHILTALIQKYDYKMYLEIGIDSGRVFRSVPAPFKESVDPADGQYSHANLTHEMTFDRFFEEFTKII